MDGERKVLCRERRGEASVTADAVPRFPLTPGGKSWGKQSEQRAMENRSKFVKDSFLCFLLFFLPADPYQTAGAQ